MIKVCKILLFYVFNRFLSSACIQRAEMLCDVFANVLHVIYVFYIPLLV